MSTVRQYFSNVHEVKVSRTATAKEKKDFKVIPKSSRHTLKEMSDVQHLTLTGPQCDETMIIHLLQ